MLQQHGGQISEVVISFPFSMHPEVGLLYPMGVKSCTSDWDLNPRSRDSNPAKTHSLPTEIIHLVSGLNEAQVLDVSSQKEFSEKQSDW